MSAQHLQHTHTEQPCQHTSSYCCYHHVVVSFRVCVCVATWSAKWRNILGALSGVPDAWTNDSADEGSKKKKEENQQASQYMLTTASTSVPKQWEKKPRRISIANQNLYTTSDQSNRNIFIHSFVHPSIHQPIHRSIHHQSVFYASNHLSIYSSKHRIIY
jgi:hypothetical protein